MLQKAVSEKCFIFHKTAGKKIMGKNILIKSPEEIRTQTLPGHVPYLFQQIQQS
jgi:hypothetical protein